MLCVTHCMNAYTAIVLNDPYVVCITMKIHNLCVRILTVSIHKAFTLLFLNFMASHLLCII